MNNKTILHLGAGKCSELDGYLATDAENIILLEANGDLADELSSRVKDSNRVEILNYAISDQVDGLLNVFNFIKVSSLHKPTGLFELYPGIQTVRQTKIDIKTIQEIVHQLQLNNNVDNLLIVDTPGEEFNCLKNLYENDQLYLFSQIHLHCGIISLYEDSKSSSEIIEFLINLGYEVINKNTDVDPDRPCWVLQLDNLKLEYQELNLKLDLVKNEHEKLIADQQNEIEELKQNGALTVKLLTLKEADLKDLQQRYDKALTIQENQYQLLSKLTEQLSLASNYLHQITDDNLIQKEQRKIQVYYKTNKSNTMTKRKLPRRGK